MSNPESELEETENMSAGKKVSITANFVLRSVIATDRSAFLYIQLFKKNSVFRPWFHNF